MYKKLVYLAAAALLAACSGPRSPQEKLTVNDKKIDAMNAVLSSNSPMVDGIDVANSDANDEIGRAHV